jgi:hypothetical protein
MKLRSLELTEKQIELLSEILIFAQNEMVLEKDKSNALDVLILKTAAIMALFGEQDE